MMEPSSQSYAVEKGRREPEAKGLHETPLPKQIAGAFLTLLDLERGSISSHCKRVARWARELGMLHALTDHELDELETAALLHDIGFLSAAIAPLSAPINDRTPDEKVKRHPLIGFSILSQINGFEQIAVAVLHHHERYDGSGFPHKLRGERIPLYARIIAVADLFDLETHPAAASSVDLDAIRRKISMERGRGLDPEITNRFLFIVTTSDDLHHQDSKTMEIPFSALKPGMVLARDLRSLDGTLLLKAGIMLTEPILKKAFTSNSIEWLLTTAHVDASSLP